MPLGSIWGIGIGHTSADPYYYSNISIINNTVIGAYGTSEHCYILLRSSLLPNNIIIRNNVAEVVNTDDPPHTYVDHNFNITSYNPEVEFVDYVNGDMHLANGSNFINAGSSEDAPAEDLDRNVRPQGQGYDIGAYEYISSTPLPSILYGDISGDNAVDISDALMAAQSSVGLITLNSDSDQTKKGDVSGDGKVSAYDAALILQKIAGLISKFPVE